MRIFTGIVWVLLLLFVAADVACQHYGVQLPRPVGILAFPLVMYVWMYDGPGWKNLGERDEKPNTSHHSRKSKANLPPGYTGPFWNKPSQTFLQANARPFTIGQEIAVYLAWLVPFALLAYLALHH